MCIFLHTCHADRRVGWGLGVGVGGVRGVGGGLIAFCRLLPVASSFRHAPDVTLYRSSLAILDTLMMLRSIDLLLQSSTRSRCYVRNKVKLALGHEPKDFLIFSCLDTLPMLRPEQSETCLGTWTQRLPGLGQKQLLAVRMSSLARTKKKRPCQLLWAVDSSNALKCRIQLKTHSNTHTHNSLFMKLESTIPYIKKGAPRCNENTKKTKNLHFAVAPCNMM